uniref:R-spondin 4 n=1 Tax=Echeneis naucrates TaxID=173247 RepID=A0A665T1P3_ECHNA
MACHAPKTHEIYCWVVALTLSGLKRNSTSDDCRSCLECSRDNGCVRCPERLFLFLQREGMSHHGTCLHACPAGHYGQRGKDINHCMKCRSPDCEHCFSRDFCTKCKPNFHLYKGKCLSSCPEGTVPHHTDCLEDCLLASLGGWSEWSICLRNGTTCGFRWGRQTRTRVGRTSEEKASSLCPSHLEMQRCRMKKKCPAGEEKGRKRGGRLQIRAFNRQNLKSATNNLVLPQLMLGFRPNTQKSRIPYLCRQNLWMENITQ